MAKAELGAKRTCLSCNMRFYDFDRSPIICPGCGAEFDPQNVIKSQKGRRTRQAPSKVDESAMTVDTDVNDDTIDDMDFDEDDVDNEDEQGIIQDEISADDELLPNLDKKDD